MIKLFKTHVFSNIWIALGASFYALHSCEMANIEYNYVLIFLMFFATLFSYNFQRIVRIGGSQELKSERHIWIEDNKKSLNVITSISFVIASLISFYLFEIKLLVALSIPFLIVVLYATCSTKSRTGLRDLPYVKIVVIALVWAVIVGGLPIYLSGNLSNLITIVLDKFLFIVAITIPFDIRDLNVDKSSQKTIPMLIGIKGSKGLALLLLLGSFYLNFSLGSNILLTSVFYGLTLFLIIKSSEKQSELYFSGLIDGLLILSPLVFI